MKGYLLTRPHDLPPVEQLAKGRPHGHKMRYMAGCRCRRCRAGIVAYNKRLRDNAERFGPNDIVSTAPVRRHLLLLQKHGIGHKSVGRLTGVGKTSVGEIIWQGKKWIRRRNAKKILALQPTLDNLPRITRIDATETIAKVRQMVKWGIPRSTIAHDCIGEKGPGLQLRALKGLSSVVCAKTARKVRDYFDKVLRMRRMWAATHGRIAARHYVYWKPGRHGMTVRSFELRPFAVTYDYHNTYSPELKELMRLRLKVMRKYRERKKEAA